MEEKKNVLRIRKGNRYKCIKDVILYNGEVAYIKGKTYISYKDNCLTNELNDENHIWDDSCSTDDYFELYCGEKKNVFVYIRGNKVRGKEVIKVLLNLGGINYYGLDGSDEERVYLIDYFGIIIANYIDDSFNYNWLKTHYTEIFLPEEEHKFKPFDKVLGKVCSISPWRADLYSYYDEGNYSRPAHVCIGGAYDECIPYEGNEYLLGTINEPRE